MVGMGCGLEEGNAHFNIQSKTVTLLVTHIYYMSGRDFHRGWFSGSWEYPRISYWESHNTQKQVTVRKNTVVRVGDTVRSVHPSGSDFVGLLGVDDYDSAL